MSGLLVPLPMSLEIKMQRVSLEAGNADHHLAAGCFFFVRQIDVMVQQLAVAGDDPGLTLTTGAAATEEWRVDAHRLDRLQHAFVMADLHGLAGPQELDREGLAW